MDSKVIPLVFLHSFKFLFFDSFTNSPFFQSYGMVSWLHTLLNSSCTFLAENSTSAFSNSAVMLSMPGAFSFFKFVIAFLTSCKVCSLSTISSINSPNSILLPLQILRDWLAVPYLTCSVQRFCTSSFLLRRFPSLSNTAVPRFGPSSHNFFVKPYTVDSSYAGYIPPLQLQMQYLVTISFYRISNFASLLCPYPYTFFSTVP